MTSSRPKGHGAVRAYDWIAHRAAKRGSKEAIRDLGTYQNQAYATGYLNRIKAIAAIERAALGGFFFLAHNTYTIVSPDRQVALIVSVLCPRIKAS